MRPISEVATDLGLSAGDYHAWGPGVAKVDASVAFRDDPLAARLVLVSAINPTPAGEGKTTMTIGLTQAARNSANAPLVMQVRTRYASADASAVCVKICG